MRLSDTNLGSSHLRGVAADEVEHGLFGGEFGDGGEDTAGVAGEEDNVVWVAVADAGNLGVLNVLDGVGAAEILVWKRLSTPQ